MVRHVFFGLGISIVSVAMACSSGDSSAATMEDALDGSSDDASTEDVAAEAFRAESLRLFEDEAVLDSVSAEPSGDFLAIGTKYRESPPGAPERWHQDDLLIARVHGATVTTLPAPNIADAIPGGATFTSVSGWPVLGLDEGGNGLASATFVTATPADGGFTGTKLSFVAEYRGGVWTMLRVDSLPLGGAFSPVAVHCTVADGCLLLANRSPNAAIVDGSTSLTVFRRKDGVWTTELDERETDRVLQPRAVVQHGQDIVLVGQASHPETGVSVGIARRKHAGQWTQLRVPDGDSAVFHAWLGSHEVAAIGRRDTTSSVEVFEGNALVRRTDESARLLAGVGLPHGKHLVVGERDTSPGWLPVATIVTGPRSTPVALPPYKNPSGIRAVAARGNVVLAVGEQSARSKAGPNRHAPLLVRIAPDTIGADDGVLPDEAREGCKVPADCAGETWGVRCSGHFACRAGACERVCDAKACGDGVCDSAGGETAQSCQDCM